MRAIQQVSAIVCVLVALTGAVPSRASASVKELRGPSSAPGQAPDTLDDLLSRALQLREDGKLAEAAAVLQKFVATNPATANAHLLLANIQRDLADATKGPMQTRHFATAATHYRSALDLTTESSLRLPIYWSLVKSYLDGNRLAEAETHGRRLLREDAANAEAYALLFSILRKAGRSDAAAEILPQARNEVAKDAEAQSRLGLYMWQHVHESPHLSKGSARILLDEALVIADGVLAINPDGIEALRFKTAALQLYASRVEQDEKRKTVLIADADRLWERASKLRDDERRAEEQAATGVKISAECAEAERTASLAFVNDPRPVGEVLAVYEKALAVSPDCLPAHRGMAATQRGLADKITDRGAKSSASRTGHLELAAKHFQRAIDLEPESDEARSAVASLIDVFGSDSLNRPAESEALTRAAIKRYPTDPKFHYLLLRMLLTAGRSEAVDGVLRTARAAIPATAEGRQQIGVYLWDIVYRDPKLPRVEAQKLLAEAVAMLDEALGIKPDYLDAVVYKKLVLELQATRVEQSPERVKALRAEAARLDTLAKELMARRKP